MIDAWHWLIQAAKWRFSEMPTATDVLNSPLSLFMVDTESSAAAIERMLGIVIEDSNAGGGEGGNAGGGGSEVMSSVNVGESGGGEQGAGVAGAKSWAHYGPARYLGGAERRAEKTRAHTSTATAIAEIYSRGVAIVEAKAAPPLQMGGNNE
jgi:hypothetical protein